MCGEPKNKENPVFKKWEEDWANDLFREYPEGLGHPNFQAHGDARFVWSVNGFVAFQKLSIASGEFKKVPIGGVKYRIHPDEPNEQRRIA